jgi:hypothetical protein
VHRGDFRVRLDPRPRVADEVQRRRVRRLHGHDDRDGARNLVPTSRFVGGSELKGFLICGGDLSSSHKTARAHDG